MDFYKLGQKIAEERIKNNKTQEELAEIVGITPSFLSHIETGKRKPSFDTLIQISKSLNMSLDYLVLDENLDKKIKENVYIKELYKKIEFLEESKKEKLIDIMIYISQKI